MGAQNDDGGPHFSSSTDHDGTENLSASRQFPSTSVHNRPVAIVRMLPEETNARLDVSGTDGFRTQPEELL